MKLHEAILVAIICVFCTPLGWVGLAIFTAMIIEVIKTVR